MVYIAITKTNCIIKYYDW